MGELSLDLNSSSASAPQSIDLFLKEVSRIGNLSDKLSKVDAYVKSLEEEMKKIDAFKRELPLCMLLLNDAIRTLKLERMQWKMAVTDFAGDGVGGSRRREKENDLKDKKNWMSSAQLWSINSYSKTQDKREGNKEYGPSANAKNNDNKVLPKNGEGGGAFLPFKGFPGFLAKMEEKERKVQEEPALSLVTPGLKRSRPEPASCLMNSKLFGGGLGIPAPSTEITHSSLQTPSQSQAARKQRRCWSPDLHRRFLNALQQLGGSQVATPKQIRELMQVDGLTNDEVKSHLQKYRLHTRRYPPSGNAKVNAVVPDSQKFALFGGLWAPQEHCGNPKTTTTSESESPQGPLHLMGTSGGTSTTGGDSMEDEEDEKSESYTWKGQFHKLGQDDA